MLSRRHTTLIAIFTGCVLAVANAHAQALFQPPGANLTYGDVTHGMRAQSAASNPAAAAAELARQGDTARSGTVLSLGAGIEYGNIQEIWDFYDEVAQAYKRSPPGTEVDAPGQLPEIKPDFDLDLDMIWDLLDPDIEDELNSIAREIATQTAILAVIKTEGYGKAWLAADAPFVFKNERWGGAWTMQLQWSGTSRAFGMLQPIEFDEDAARAAVQGWYDTEISRRPSTLNVGGQVQLLITTFGAVSFALQNDSLIASKSSRLFTLSTGYSRGVWSNGKGRLYLGGEVHLHDMRLSRFGVRFGDITDSKELFNEILDADFERDIRLGVDVGALWVAENYQLGAQLTSVNAPDFRFPDLLLDAVSYEPLIQQIRNDTIYTMERQLKLEASLFSPNRRWSLHLGVDANDAADPVGDDYQWLTASAGYNTESRWIPGIRAGYRQNLAGTEKTYVSLGATFFRFFNLDISSALNTTQIDGEKLPEGLMASLGFQINW